MPTRFVIDSLPMVAEKPEDWSAFPPEEVGLQRVHHISIGVLVFVDEDIWVTARQDRPKLLEFK
ncbi:hypothetical protein RBB80_04275 [Tunturiibacter gelidiferens]